MEYGILKPEKIKYQELPRKLKKRLRNCLIKSIDSSWKTGEIKIKAVVIDRWDTIKQKPDWKRYYVTDYNLG